MKTKISLNLFHYYRDHRRLSRLLIKDDLKTVNDLQKRISKCFQIDNFYLLCDNHYLPPDEDIELLKDNDIIYVLPLDLSTKKERLNTINVNKNDETISTTNLNHLVEVKTSKKRRRCISPIQIDSVTKKNSITVESVQVLNKEESSKYLEEIKDDNNRENSRSYSINELIDFNEERKKRKKKRKEESNENEQKTDEDKNKEKKCKKQKTEKRNKVHSQHVTENNNEEIPVKNGNVEKKNENIENKIKKMNVRQQTSIGQLLENLNNYSTNSNLNDISSNLETTTDNFVTKRVRKRTRRRKRSSKQLQLEHDDSKSEKEILPLKIQGVPKSHIKFPDAESENVFTHSTPLEKMSNTSNGVKIWNYKLSDIDPKLYPAMTKMPEMNDVILFRMLKMGEDYAPRISDYILANVEEINADNNMIKLNVLDGHKELVEPKGKFSCIPEEDEDELITESITINPNALIGAHLIN